MCKINLGIKMKLSPKCIYELIVNFHKFFQTSFHRRLRAKLILPSRLTLV